MKKIVLKYKMDDYYKQACDCFAANVCALMGIPRDQGFTPCNQEVVAALGSVQKALLIHPAGLPQVMIDAQADVFSSVKDVAPVRANYITCYPSTVAASFATMYAGRPLSAHGIRADGQKLTAPCLFDALAAAGKKSALVTSSKSALPALFSGKPVDIIYANGDTEAVNKAMAALKEQKYDLVSVYLQGYKDVSRFSSPVAADTVKAAQEVVKNFNHIRKAAEVYWSEYNVLIGFCPERGCHKQLFGCVSGTAVAQDLNLVHFYGVKQAGSVVE